MVGSATRRIARACLAVALAAGSAAAAEPLTHLEGAVHAASTPALFGAIGAAAGRFSLDSSGAGDLRETPGTLVLSTPTGAITAVVTETPRVFGVRRVDPATARPLRADAALDATCATGAEPACWLAGDPVAQDRAMFDALCDAGVRFSTPDTSPCLLEMWRDSSYVAGAILAQILGSVLSGSNVGRATVVGQLLPGLVGLPVADRLPIVGLNPDANDGPGEGPFGVSSLEARITAEQGAALGCGAFWGSGCDDDGMELFASEAGVVFQSWSGPPNTPIDWDAGDPGQPGTVDFSSEIVAPRGGSAIAGTRGPDDAAYAPDRDGCTSAEAAGCDGAHALVQPLSGEPLRSELAAFSWNLLLTSVVFSSDGAKPEIPCADGQDPATCRTPDEFVAAPDSAYREDGCSYRRPQLCRNAIALRSNLTTQLDDDPSGPPRTRWLWESGAEYAITAASGDLAAFLGGTAHVSAPELSRVADSAIGAAIVLVPPAGAKPDATSPLVRSLPDTALGFAYAVVPEPSAGALGMGVIAILATSARRRHAKFS